MALGKAPVQAPVVVSFSPTVNPAGVAQPACTRCGDCCGGCNVGAKNTVALTYLPDAARHGAEIFTHAKVRHVARAPQGGWRVHFERQDAVANGAASLGTVTADVVVLAAGTLGSTEILLRSREQGLAVSDRLGKGFSANGDIIAFGYGAKLPVNAIGVGHPAKVEGLDVGACVSGQIEIVDEQDLANSLTIQEGVLPSALAPILPALFIPNGRLLGALKSLIAGVYKGPFASLQTFFAVSHDSASGRLVLEDDRIALAWPGAKDEPVYRRLDAALEALVRQAGGSYVKNPLAGTMMGQQPATAHPLGGCGMGRERGEGVVNHKCQVFDAGPGSRLSRRARWPLRGRRGDHAALAGRQPAAHHHGAGRARHAASGARPRPRLRRRAADLCDTHLRNRAGRPLSPRGRGREAMTYGRGLEAACGLHARWRGRKSFGRAGEGRLFAQRAKAPSSAPSGHLLPKGRRGACGALGEQQ